jgi:hypothetical protein
LDPCRQRDPKGVGYSSTDLVSEVYAVSGYVGNAFSSSIHVRNAFTRRWHRTSTKLALDGFQPGLGAGFVGIDRAPAKTAMLRSGYGDRSPVSDHVLFCVRVLVVRSINAYSLSLGKRRLPIRRSPSKLCATLDSSRSLRMDRSSHLTSPYDVEAPAGIAKPIASSVKCAPHATHLICGVSPCR